FALRVHARGRVEGILGKMDDSRTAADCPTDDFELRDPVDLLVPHADLDIMAHWLDGKHTAFEADTLRQDHGHNALMCPDVEDRCPGPEPRFLEEFELGKPLPVPIIPRTRVGVGDAHG